MDKRTEIYAELGRLGLQYKIMRSNEVGDRLVDVSEVKQCPFCGKPAMMSIRNSGDVSVGCIDEDECGAHLWSTKNIRHMISRWNRRAYEEKAV